MTSKKRLLIYISLLASSIVGSFLFTALNTALPAMMSDLGVDVNTGQWISSGFSLATGIIMPLTAFLITRFKTKKLYLAGLIAFIAGSVLCAIAPSFVVMMVGRILQAAGSGIITALTQVVILSIFPKEQQGTYMGWYGLAVSAAPMVAPTLGGIMVDLAGWRSIFWLVAGIMLLSFLLAAAVFDDVLPTKVTSFDVLSFLLSILTFGGLTLGVGFITSQGLTAPITLVALGVGIVAGILFVFRQLHSEDPFLELRTLQYRNYTLGVLGSMVMYLVMMGGTVLVPLYLQRVAGLSAAASGLATLPGSVASIIVSPIAGKMYDKVGMRKLFLVGGLLFVIGNAGHILAQPLPVLIVFYAIRSAAITCMMMPFVTWGVSSIKDKTMTAHGSALLTALRTISGAIGSAVFVGVMNGAAQKAAAAGNTNSGLAGFRTACIGMTAVAIVMYIAGILLIHDEK